MSSGARVVALSAVALGLSASLAGCGLLAKVAAESPGSTTGSSLAASPSPNTSADPTPTIEKVIINCNLVLSDAHAAGLTPSLKPIPTFEPAAGTLGAAMVAQGGRPCGWGAESTASLEVVVAIPTAAGLATARAAAASTGQVAHVVQADAGYFATVNGVGQVQIFMGSYWIEVASPTFTTPDQASSVYGLVIDDLRSAGG